MNYAHCDTFQVNLSAKQFAGLNGIPVSPELKQHFESTVRYVIDNFLSDLNIDSLEEIIVTDCFVSTIKQFQRDHGMREEVTDNELGTALGKMIIAKDTGMYYVFINAERATFLLSEDLLNILYKDDPEGRQEGVSKRDFAINLLAHELSHVEYHSTVETRTLLPHYNAFDKYIEELAFIMFDEYYACRRACEFCTASDRTTTRDTILKIESKALELVSLFRKNEISAVEFLPQFQEWLQMSLNEACYLLGDASFEHDVTELNECRIHSIIDDIDWTFNDLYREARQEKKILMPLCVRNSVLDYYRQFDIDFDADENGVHIIVL